MWHVLVWGRITYRRRWENDIKMDLKIGGGGGLTNFIWLRTGKRGGGVLKGNRTPLSINGGDFFLIVRGEIGF